MSARATCSCGWTATYGSPARAEAMSARHICKTADGVRRATRRYRCARCGLEATYQNAGAAEARYWFSRHSCRKREEAMLRHAMAEAKEALIDRTPKTCTHKVADHQHGSLAMYHLDRCRCEVCCKAVAERESWRRRQKAYGRYNKYVPALPVREHIQMLRDSGMGLKTIAAAAGIGTGTISKIVYGVYKDTGLGGLNRKGQGELLRPPSARVLRETAEKIYAIDPTWTGVVPLAAGRPDPDGTPLARKRLQALVALGWSMSELGRRLGLRHPTNARPVIRGPRIMQRRTVDAANALFDQLCMTLPPERTKVEKQTAARSRRFAREQGWLPPLALEDLDDLVDVQGVSA